MATIPLQFDFGSCRASGRSSARIFTRLIHTQMAFQVTAFNSTDIRSVQDSVATPVTATMVTVCISPDLSDTNSFHQCCWSIIPVTACSYRLHHSVSNMPVLFCYIRLIQPWQPNKLFQSDTVSSEQSVGDNSLIQLWYHACIRPEGATGCNRSVAFLRVYLQYDIFLRFLTRTFSPFSTFRAQKNEVISRE